MKPRGIPFKRGRIPWNKGEMIELQCIYCNKKYLAFPFQARAGRKYCSRPCARKHNGENLSIRYLGSGSPSWKGGISRPYIVPEAIRIHGYNCQRCGTDKFIDTHHIDGNPLNNPPDGSNWKRLCKKCHMSRGHPERNTKPKVILTCIVCDNKFIVNLLYATKHKPKYCSRNCFFSVYRPKSNLASLPPSPPCSVPLPVGE